MERHPDIPLLKNNIFHMQKHVYIVIPALLHQMEKFQLSVGLNNGWLCNTVAEIPVDPAEEKIAKCCKECPLQTDYKRFSWL